jgi:hypothetical protein
VGNRVYITQVPFESQEFISVVITATSIFLGILLHAESMIMNAIPYDDPYLVRQIRFVRVI